MFKIISPLIASLAVTAGAVAMLAPVLTIHLDQEKEVAALLCDADAQIRSRYYKNAEEQGLAVERCTRKAVQEINDRYGPVYQLSKAFV